MRRIFARLLRFFARPLRILAPSLRFLLPTVTIGLFTVVVFHQPALEASMRALFPDAVAHLYERVPMRSLFYDHLLLVGGSSAIASVIGMILGVWVTRESGRDFLNIARSCSSFMQTFPPVAVLALASPFLGFGVAPTVFALVLFSILPILNNTITGLSEIQPAIIDAARGVGMNRNQILFGVELPMAARVISAGVRISLIINIGTATVGAVIGAGGFGVIIIAGLVRNNPAFIFSGAAATALFAFTINWIMLQVESAFYQPRHQL